MEIGDGGGGVFQECGERGDLAGEFEGKSAAEGEMGERGVEGVERGVGEEQGRVRCVHLSQMRAVR